MKACSEVLPAAGWAGAGCRRPTIRVHREGNSRSTGSSSELRDGTQGLGTGSGWSGILEIPGGLGFNRTGTGMGAGIGTEIEAGVGARIGMGMRMEMRMGTGSGSGWESRTRPPGAPPPPAGRGRPRPPHQAPPTTPPSANGKRQAGQGKQRPRPRPPPLSQSTARSALRAALIGRAGAVARQKRRRGAAWRARWAWGRGCWRCWCSGPWRCCSCWRWCAPAVLGERGVGAGASPGSAVPGRGASASAVLSSPRCPAGSPRCRWCSEPRRSRPRCCCCPGRARVRPRPALRR